MFRPSAYNAINAHATFKDCEKSSQSFDASALYLLSSDSTPEAGDGGDCRQSRRPDWPRRALPTDLRPVLNRRKTP